MSNNEELQWFNEELFSVNSKLKNKIEVDIAVEEGTTFRVYLKEY